MRRLILAISICSAILVNAGSALAESTLGTSATTSESDREQDQMEAQGGAELLEWLFSVTTPEERHYLIEAFLNGQADDVISDFLADWYCKRLFPNQRLKRVICENEFKRRLREAFIFYLHPH